MRIRCSKPDRGDAVVVFQANFQGLLTGLRLGNCFMVDSIRREVNIWLLPRMGYFFVCQILRFRTVREIRLLLQVAYLASAIRSSRASLAVTFVDEAVEFYYLKFALPKVRFVAVQNGYRGSSHFYERLAACSARLTKPHCDAIFAWSPKYIDLYRSQISSEVIATGSILNNMATRFAGAGRVVGYVSLFEQADSAGMICPGPNQFSASLMRELDKRAVRVAADWCHNNDFKLAILRRGRDEDEVRYFTEILGFSPIFYEFDPIGRSYGHLDSLHMLVSTFSSLGFEAAGRGVRTAIIWPTSTDLGLPVLPAFGFTSGLANHGPFWTSDTSESSIQSLIERVGGMSASEWAQHQVQFGDSLCRYDPGNSLALEVLASFRL